MSAKTDRVVQLRREYDADHGKAGAWLVAERDLTDTEFDIYMADYRAKPLSARSPQRVVAHAHYTNNTRSSRRRPEMIVPDGLVTTFKKAWETANLDPALEGQRTKTALAEVLDALPELGWTPPEEWLTGHDRAVADAAATEQREALSADDAIQRAAEAVHSWYHVRSWSQCVDQESHLVVARRAIEAAVTHIPKQVGEFVGHAPMDDIAMIRRGNLLPGEAKATIQAEIDRGLMYGGSSAGIASAILEALAIGRAGGEQ